MQFFGRLKTPLSVLTTLVVLLVLIAVDGCDTVTVEGRVTVKGSEPATWVALVETGNGEPESPVRTEYALVGPLADEIRSRHQGRHLVVRGRIVSETRGPGFPAELEVIEILEVRDRPAGR